MPLWHPAKLVRIKATNAVWSLVNRIGNTPSESIPWNLLKSRSKGCIGRLPARRHIERSPPSSQHAQWPPSLEACRAGNTSRTHPFSYSDTIDGGPHLIRKVCATGTTRCRPNGRGRDYRFPPSAVNASRSRENAANASIARRKLGWPDRVLSRSRVHLASSLDEDPRAMASHRNKTSRRKRFTRSWIRKNSDGAHHAQAAEFLRIQLPFG